MYSVFHFSKYFICFGKPKVWCEILLIVVVVVVQGLNQAGIEIDCL